MKIRNKNHMPSEQIRMDCFLILISIICGGANFYTFLLLLDNEISWVMFISLHILLLGFILGWYPFFARKMKEVYRDYIFLLIFFLASGFMGSLGYIIYCAVIFFMYKNSGDLDELYKELFPERDISKSTKIYENILTRRDRKAEERDIVSFRDTLSFGTLQQKQSVIASIIDDYNAIFAPILLLATKDKIAAVRTSSATAISGILNKFLQKQIILKNEVEAEENNIELWEKYANFLDEYSYCGLLDQSRHKDVLKQALDANMKVYELNPAMVSSIHKIIRILVRLEDYKKAKEWIDIYKSSSHGQPSAIDDWNIETLYNLGDYAELRKQARKRLQDIEDMPESHLPKEYIEALKLWGTPKNV